ncbi:unnamed protein product, partial [Ixodes persulcatus]
AAAAAATALKQQIRGVACSSPPLDVKTPFVFNFRGIRARARARTTRRSSSVQVPARPRTHTCRRKSRALSLQQHLQCRCVPRAPVRRRPRRHDMSVTIAHPRESQKRRDHCHGGSGHVEDDVGAGGDVVTPTGRIHKEKVSRKSSPISSGPEASITNKRGSCRRRRRQRKPDCELRCAFTVLPSHISRI